MWRRAPGRHARPRPSLRTSPSHTILGLDECFRQAGALSPAATTSEGPSEPDAHTVPAGFFVLGPRRSEMPNHLTPEELSKELGMEREDVIRLCLQEGVPIYQGKIDKTLFQAQLEAVGAAPPRL